MAPAKQMDDASCSWVLKGIVVQVAPAAPGATPAALCKDAQGGGRHVVCAMGGGTVTKALLQLRKPPATNTNSHVAVEQHG